MFKNIDDAIFWIENKKKKEKRKDLSRITNIIKDLEIIDTSFIKVHVCGTNGKGSVCHILNSCLKTKYKVGVFTSPYVDIFNERIKINNDYISDDELLRLINFMYLYSIDYEKQYDDIIPFFELVFIISLLYFKEQKVDVALIEVGVGGVLDCTNALNYEVSVITNVSYDHVDALGNDIESICAHKFGILKDNNTLFSTIDEKLYPILKKNIVKKKIKKNLINFNDIKNINLKLNETSFTYKDFDFKTSLIGLHQVYNTALCIEVLNKFFMFSYFEISKLLTINFNGRFEILSHNPLIIVDGAHNQLGIESLVKSLNLIFNEKINFCFTAMKDKDIKNMILNIESIAKTISFTKLDYYRNVNLDNLKSNLDNVYYYESIDELMSNINLLEGIIVFTGSLYFISEIRKYFK